MWKCRLSAALTAFLLCAMPICGAFATDVNASVPQVEVGEAVEGNASTTVEILEVQSYTYPVDTPILTVTVLDEKEAPFPDVQVKLYERPQAGATSVNTLEVTGSSRESHLTDRDGKRTFHLLGWETQEYAIKIDHTGYEPVSEDYFCLKECRDIERTIRLQPKASLPSNGGNGGGGGDGNGGNDTEVVQPDPATEPKPATEPEPEAPIEPETLAQPETSDEPGTQDDAPDTLGLTPSDGGAGGGNGGSGGGSGGGGGDIADPTGGDAPDSTPTGTGNTFSAATETFQMKTANNIAGSHFAAEDNCITHVQVVVCCGLTLMGGLLWRAHLRAHYRHLRDYHRKRINSRDDDDDLDDDDNNDDDDNMLGGGDDIPLYGGGMFDRQPQPGFAFRAQDK